MGKLEDDLFFEKRMMGDPPREVLVALFPMSKEDARKAYPYRPFFKDFAESRFGGNEMHSDKELLDNKEAAKCAVCEAPTKRIYLDDEGICPDCNGLAELNGDNPHAKK